MKSNQEIKIGINNIPNDWFKPKIDKKILKSISKKK